MYGASQSLYYHDLVDPTRYELDLLVFGTFAVPLMIACGLAGAATLPILATLSLKYNFKTWTIIICLTVSLLAAAMLPFAEIHASWLGMHWDTPSLNDTNFWRSLWLIALICAALSLLFSQQAVARLEI